jgi:DNA-binding MarR family transcriptional regulator
MPEVQPVDQDYNLWVLLNQVQTFMSNARDIELLEYGTTAMQTAVLFIANALGERTTPAAISRWLLRKPAAISGLLDRMEKAGLIVKVKDLPKRNWIRIVLTAKGQKAYEQSLKRKPVHQIMGCLSEEEREQLTSILIKLRNKAAEVLDYRQKIPYPQTPAAPGSKG